MCKKRNLHAVLSFLSVCLSNCLVSPIHTHTCTRTRAHTHTHTQYLGSVIVVRVHGTQSTEEACLRLRVSVT